MSQRVDPNRKESARKKFNQGEAIPAIAKQFGVSRRTIERWAEEGSWRELRDVIPICEGRHGEVVNPTPSRNRRQRIDEGEVVETAIAYLATLLGYSVDEAVKPVETTAIDVRSLSSVMLALVRLLEYRRKIEPPTAAELAEQAIALGVAPDQFMTALREAWRLRA